MNNLLVLPLLIPLGTAILLLFLNRRVSAQRWVSMTGLLGTAASSCLIVSQVHSQGIQVLRMGGWLPPYGIVFVADMLGALLVLTTSVVGAACLWYAFGTIGSEREKHYFYPLTQFLLAGINGSFLTGDLFNLFVCFEVLLIASYALIVLGGTRRQLRETLKYMLINILSSTLFVAAVAYLYGVVGTLNMADLSHKVAEVGQYGILQVIAVLFLIVFSLKSGLFLFFWLPGSYAAPPPAVAALFAALLTKVGVYALLRTSTLLFVAEPVAIQGWIHGLAAVTMVLGSLGAVAYRDIRLILNYNVVVSVGFIALGLAVSSREALDGAVFYLIHDMVAKALLFILGGWIAGTAGTYDIKEMGGLMKRYPLQGWLFFAAVLAIAGIPPFSGFAGKLLLIQGGLREGYYGLTAVALASSLIVLYSLIRVFMHAFWGERKPLPPMPNTRPVSRMTVVLPAAGLGLLVIGMGLGSEFVYRLVAEAGQTLADSAAYIDAVLRKE
ncbi:multicomponent Na+:H+ antiporter subunit D [Paenibacillus sp. UNCCL117]|uniref:Na+/H+ antiporter subunit D n=1 Tax=unclassified Paenibacillus TaxID=185978 RepID=UPI000883795D|nr:MULTISPECIES: Na+/H+ antiporter subunit D [unclassified Paenibacillus]SDC18242.1 multisubunit sodium/proton antiporter, MrpD subunit [Paenibacillus sp. cl123]SFW18168.1 multicomponent Na+:H+ antiporter subunit D [Paenibacillus sp. UNCCL117]